MIKVKTVLNNTKKDGGYCFSSVSDTVAGTDEIIEQMRQYNSTLTEADAIAALTVLDKSVRTLLEKGCKVRLPWVTLCFAARGNAESRTSSFAPGKDGGRFVLKATADKDVEKEIAPSVVYESDAGEIVKAPRILSLHSVDSSGKLSDELAFKARDTLRIWGRNLKFDFSDNEQGVFFTNESTGRTLRAESFTRAATSTIDTSLPEAIAPGRYEVSVVKKEKSRGYLRTFASEQITVL